MGWDMKRYEDLDESSAKLLFESLRSRQYYLLLGSGVSLDSEGPQGRMRSTNALREEIVRLKGIPSSSSIQQAYSLLDDAERSEYLTEHYACKRVGQTINTITRLPWRRIYTLNIDDCFEAAFAEFAKSEGADPGSLESKNFDEDFQDLQPTTFASVVHLHGDVRKASSGYIFSHAEYAKNMTRANSWMLTLVQLIRVEPFVVAGTSLEEIDVTFYLEQRNEANIRKDVAPSILVEPFPNKLTERLCEKHGLVLFEGTAQKFFETLERRFERVSSSWMQVTRDDLSELQLSKRSKILFGSTFERVPKYSAKDADAGVRFLLGAEPTWSALEANADIARDITVSLRQEIVACINDPEIRVFLLLDEPGSGKTALLRRIAHALAKTVDWVLFFSGKESIDEDSCAEILDSISGPLYVFVDNWADHSAYFIRILAEVAKRDIVFVCAERSYRKPYIESGLAEEDFEIAERQLELTAPEGEDLVARFRAEGLSAIDDLSAEKLGAMMRSLEGEPIAVAACRIQKNFRSFDAILKELVRESSDEELSVYATATISRFCYSDGVRQSVLYEATRSHAVGALMDLNSRLPLKYSDGGGRFVVPARPVVADRVLNVLLDRNPRWVAEVFVNLSNALAARVNRHQIKLRSPDARLSGRLMDYDQIKRFIDPHAEYFYESIRESWSWNSRYWEQLSLLKLDRFLVDRTDTSLLDAGVQHARFAYSIEQHPLSLTTLAKLLFVAMAADKRGMDNLFSEAWSLINTSIDIESRWQNIKATAFIVGFRGVLEYVKLGGLLTGEQADRLRDVISITHARKLRDPLLQRLREDVAALA